VGKTGWLAIVSLAPDFQAGLYLLLPNRHSVLETSFMGACQELVGRNCHLSLYCKVTRMNTQRIKWRYSMSAAFGFAFALLACVRAVADHHNSPQRAISLRFFAAIRKGDAAAVKRMLDSGVSANSHEIMLTRPRVEKHTEGGKEYPGRSAIVIACESGNVAI